MTKSVQLVGKECEKKKSTVTLTVTCHNFNELKHANESTFGTKKSHTVQLEKHIEAVQAKFEDSNVKMIGSKEDIEQRVKAAKKEDAWFKLGNQVGQTPGLDIWRIEKFKVVSVPKETYGSFYDGDSYIILHTYKKENKLQWNIHFWLGLNSSQDEIGTAAYKTVELDDLLGGTPVEYREVQGHESQLFMSHFPNGVRILSGGVETGFNHVTAQTYQPRLLQVKGKKYVKIVEIPLLFSSMNHGDCFLLDAGLNLYIWEGDSCSNMERFKVNTLAQTIQGERGDKPKVIIVKEKKVVDQKELQVFNSHLIGSESEIKSAQEGGADSEEDRVLVGNNQTNIQIHKLSDKSGKIEFTKINQPLQKSLDTNDVFIVDVGYMIYAWVGAKASDNERRYAQHYAISYLNTAKKPMHTQVVRIIEKNEPADFLALLNQ